MRVYVSGRIAYKKSRQRGGDFTYTDLDVLVDISMTSSLSHILHEVIKVSSSLCTIYGFKCTPFCGSHLIMHRTNVGLLYRTLSGGVV